MAMEKSRFPMETGLSILPPEKEGRTPAGQQAANAVDQCPQEEQFEEEQEEHPEPLDILGLNEPPAPRDEYFPRPKDDGFFAIFLDLHLEQAAETFSFILKVTTSNSFPHLAHLYSYIGMGLFL